MHRGADAIDLGLALRDPAFHRHRASGAVARHGGRDPPLGVADRIERAVERQPVEIVGHLDVAGGARDAVEAEEGFGREIGGRNLGDLLPGAVGDQHDIGRRSEHRQIGEPARELLGHAGLGQLGDARVARPGGLLR